MASTKIDERGSLGSKRTRNDAKNDGEWICPQCGNLNFSFRMVCNRSNCGAARPSPSPRIPSAPLPGPFDYPPYYVGGMSMPPSLGMSGGYRPPFSVPGMRYDYGPSLSAPGPYGFLPGYGPSGLMGGMGCGPSLHGGISEYGYGFRGSPLPVPTPWYGGEFPDNSASRKRRGGPDGLSEGDWVCPKCDNVNFAFRAFCNIKKCETPRPTLASNLSYGGRDSAGTTPEGSWTCRDCGNLNYPFRTVCNRKGCGKEKPSS